MKDRCELCPHRCGAVRPDESGLCGANYLKAARAAPHYFEEPPISGTSGSGAVFFSGCPLSCVFCQNGVLSADGFGAVITPEKLSDIFLSLQDKGCHNINLVSPTPYVHDIITALGLCRDKLKIPVVYNTSGYERAETLRLLDGYIDVYLPDFKYVTPSLAEKYSAAADYPEYADEALFEMLRQRGNIIIENGIIKSGVIVRHLVLPSHKDESIKVLRHLAKRYDIKAFLLSLMSQYTPVNRACEYPEINRTLTSYEYKTVLNEAIRLGFEGFMQERGCAVSDFTPEFDLSGII